jgi:3',5'-cyclic AMP phosphodiesterase CpdA
LKKIIHLSDLHLGYVKQDLVSRFNVIVNNIIVKCMPASQFVVVITGDIVDDATQAENYELAAKYLNKLEDAGFSVLVVPGNHDYGTGSLGYQKFVPIFKEYFYGDPQIVYPKLDVIGTIAFIGLDSMAEELHWYDRLFAEGEIGNIQLTQLNKLLDNPEVAECQKRVVYFHHHPFDPLPLHELKDSEDLGKILKKHGNVDALLYGHNHEGRKHEVWGIIRCYDAGSSTRKKDMPSVHRIIDLFQNIDADVDEDFGFMTV